MNTTTKRYATRRTRPVYARRRPVARKTYPVRRRYAAQPVRRRVTKKRDYSGIGGTVGEALGSLVPIPGGGMIGKALGKMAGSIIPSVFGHGDYLLSPFKVKSNVITDGSMPPQFQSGSKKTYICHREYVGDLYSAPSLVGGATPFNVQYFPINPGIGTLFPWLSGLAVNYECYKITGMVVEYKTMSSDALNSTNTALGTVIIATSYNAALTSPFANKQSMENYEFGQSCKPSQSMLHPIECARSETVLNELYVRTSGVPSGQDARLYDMGRVAIATQGMQAANVNLGEVWVTYCIEFFKPKNTSAIGGNLNLAHYYGTSGVTTSNWFPSTSTASFTSNIPMTLNGNTLTFPSYINQGNYCINYYLQAGSGAMQPPGVTFTSNCQPLTLNTTGVGYVTSSNSATNTALAFSIYLTIIGPSAVITLASGGAGTAPSTGYDINIFEILSPAN